MRPVSDPVEIAGEESLRKATGRGWDAWFAAIDAAGGKDLQDDTTRILA